MRVIYFLSLIFIFLNTSVLVQKITFTYVFRIKEVTSYAVAKPNFDLIRSQFNTPGSTTNILLFDNIELFFKIATQILVSEKALREFLFSNGLDLRDFEFTEIKE